MKASILVAGCVLSLGALAQGLPESPHSEIGYPSPDAALAALREKPGVTEDTRGDWIVLHDRDEHTIWSIATPANPAYPTAVKRILVEKDGAVQLIMQVKCGASKATCDDTVLQFQQLNEQVREAMRTPQTAG